MINQQRQPLLQDEDNGAQEESQCLKKCCQWVELLTFVGTTLASGVLIAYLFPSSEVLDSSSESDKYGAVGFLAVCLPLSIGTGYRLLKKCRQSSIFSAFFQNPNAPVPQADDNQRQIDIRI